MIYGFKSTHLFDRQQPPPSVIGVGLWPICRNSKNFYCCNFPAARSASIFAATACASLNPPR